MPGCNEVEYLNCRFSIPKHKSKKYLKRYYKVGVYVGPSEDFFLQRYDGAPKPADSEALDLLQSECPHLYDELPANGLGEVLIDQKKL